MASASKINLTKEREDLVKANALLDDVHFPRPQHFDDRAIKCCEITWLRPSAIVSDPEVYGFDTEKPRRIDFIKTGMALDWLLVPLAHICLYPGLVYNLLSSNEGFTQNYGGMFKVRFYSFGKWLEIVIDDRFPFHTCSPPNWFPYFVNNDTGYWISLILKAYAKLHGSYEKLVNGRICEAYTEFTGGVLETYEMNNLPTKFHITLKKFYDSSCLLTAKYVYEEKDKNKHTSYWAMVDMDCGTNNIPNMKTDDLTIKLLYVFTIPKGHTVFDEVSSSKLLKLLMKVNGRDNDAGAYWITYKDFEDTFNSLYVCTLDQSLSFFVREPQVKWNVYKHSGTWFTMNSSSSHSLYDPSSIPFWSFDQLKFELRDSDSYRDDKRCEFLVSLQQPGELYNPNVALIGFFIFRLVRENERIPVKKEFFKLYRPLTYVIEHGRIAQTRIKLPQGAYMIIPVAEPENHNDYFLTLLTEATYNIWGFVPKHKVNRTPPYAWKGESPRPKYSHLKRVSREPSRTPSPSQLSPSP